MALEHAKPGEIVNLNSYADQAREGMANALTKNDAFEAVLMHLSAGQSIPPHSVDGPIIVHCLDGAVDFPVEGESRMMQAGDWMYVPGGATHAVRAERDARLLVTILFHRGA